jgi:hypothetical protein
MNRKQQDSQPSPHQPEETAMCFEFEYLYWAKLEEEARQRKEEEARKQQAAAPPPRDRAAPQPQQPVPA